MKRINLYIEEETLEKLKEILNKLKTKSNNSDRFYSTSVADLIRFSIKETFGLGKKYYDSYQHVSHASLKAGLKNINVI